MVVVAVVVVVVVYLQEKISILNLLKDAISISLARTGADEFCSLEMLPQLQAQLSLAQQDAMYTSCS